MLRRKLEVLEEKLIKGGPIIGDPRDFTPLIVKKSGVCASCNRELEDCNQKKSCVINTNNSLENSQFITNKP